MKRIVIIAFLSIASVVFADELPGDRDSAVVLTLSGDSAPLSVAADWSPIREGRYNLHRRYKKAFHYAVSEPLREYRSADFEAFLPRHAVTVGEVWELPRDRLDPLLQQFHEGARTRLRRGSPGAYALLRAVSASHAEVAFRIHGEIELVPEEVYLTLAQFSGHLVLERKTGSVVSFLLHVPDRNTNADVNAFGAADIVYIPRMELKGGSTLLRKSLPWHQALADIEAAQRLARAFYAFEEIDWVDLATGIREARAKQKPLHAVVLFGALDDESC